MDYRLKAMKYGAVECNAIPEEFFNMKSSSKNPILYGFYSAEHAACTNPKVYNKATNGVEDGKQEVLVTIVDRDPDFITSGRVRWDDLIFIGEVGSFVRSIPHVGATSMWSGMSMTNDDDASPQPSEEESKSFRKQAVSDLGFKDEHELAHYLSTFK